MNFPPAGTMSRVGTGAGCTKPRNPSPEPRRPVRGKALSLRSMCGWAVVAAVANGRLDGRLLMPARDDGGRSLTLDPGVASMIGGSRLFGTMSPAVPIVISDGGLALSMR